MVKDGPSERRKFIDNSLCQLKSNYRSVLKEYNRCLAQRNMLLKDMFLINTLKLESINDKEHNFDYNMYFEAK